ncbi:hypothetical protein C8Q70DRAFT_965936 [Cubamyces menziesii]|uniref:Uncharacterized protein n=1 Tax=Trametes cubensis TaxID=1111947 RepID=A0AAD7X882_9APHY|nr:hypothetical protein C8Q70DRAFT_965936 [Cubamyces menziesii]KAJ8462176.1 hypothetical protein ONZ51_g11067 [Trametes cubensis]
MARRLPDAGYVEDSEEEDIMTFDTPAAGRNVLPQPIPQQLGDTTVSTIQTPNFTDARPTVMPPPMIKPTNIPAHATDSSIQTPNFTNDRSFVSDISSFPTTRPTTSSISTAQSVTKPADTSISTSTSTSARSAPRPKPRPRPIFKGDATTQGDSSISASSSSIPAPVANTAISPAAIAPSAPVMEPMGAPSYIPSTSSTHSTGRSASTRERISDSGVEMADTDMSYSHDIAERAKLRSRARTQAKGKSKAPEVVGDIIELSSSDDDELSFLPKAKSKAKPKDTSKSKAAAPSSEKSKSSSKGKGKDPSAPPPRKRTKTAPTPDLGFESDVNTIPVPTSDFLPPAHIPTEHSSQLPPSDPPPSTATSSSARTHISNSQESRAPRAVDPTRDLSPLSSPPPPMPRKRKRPNLPPLGFSDQEDSAGAGASTDKAKPKSKELAAPLPLPSPSIVPETQPPVKPKPTARKKRKDLVDDGDEEWGGDAPAKPSKSRKKARVADDDDFGGGVDDDDDDWGAPSGKGKSKGKKAAKKAPPKEKKGKGKSKSKDDAALAPAGASNMPPPPVPVQPSTGTGDNSTEEGDPVQSRPSVPSAKKNGTGKGKASGKQRAVILSDAEDGEKAHAADVSTNSITAELDSPAPKKNGRKSSGGSPTSDVETKENEAPAPSTSSSSSSPVKPTTTPSALSTPSVRSNFSHANRSYTIGAKSAKHIPMSELIRRASAQPGSPFPATARPTYSPLVKASKSALRRIAPLHPHRRTPPPPPPRPPAPKKSKKMLELEEKWEMELEDSVEGWYAMPEEERAALRRAKRDAEMGFFED